VSDASRVSVFQLPASVFRAHPDSIAERKRLVAIDEAFARLNHTGLPHEEKPHQPDRPALTLEDCPLPPTWRLWDLFGGPERDYRQLSSAERRICARARRMQPVTHRGLVELDWELARDDGRFQLAQSAEPSELDWNSLKDSPRHTHAEVLLDGQRVHIDLVSATTYGPGRSYADFRIFVDGHLAGRGGSCSCSLGFGGSDLPAVAAVGRNAAITADLIDGERVVEFWQADFQ